MSLGWARSSIRRLLYWTPESKSDALSQVFWITGLFWHTAQASALRLPLMIPLFLSEIIPPTIIGALKGLSPLAHAFLYLVVADLISYWCHRWSHSFPLWWRVHSYHHAATEFNISTGVRLHPLDVGFTEIIRCIPLAIIGAPLAETALLIYVRIVADQFQHSMIPWTYGWIGRWILFSPIGHRIHHSNEQEHWDRNFGDTLVIWDRIFGTWYHGRVINSNIGLQPSDVTSANYVAGSLVGNLWRSSRSFLEEARKTFRIPHVSRK